MVSRPLILYLLLFSDELVEEGDGIVICRLCSRTFSNKSNAKRHVKNVHEKQRPFECSICCKLFSSVYNMRVHKQTHFKHQLDTFIEKDHT